MFKGGFWKYHNQREFFFVITVYTIKKMKKKTYYD